MTESNVLLGPEPKGSAMKLNYSSSKGLGGAFMFHLGKSSYYK